MSLSFLEAELCSTCPAWTSSRHLHPSFSSIGCQPQWLWPLHLSPHPRGAPCPCPCPGQPVTDLRLPAETCGPALTTPPTSLAQPPVQDPLILPWLRWPLRPGAESSGQRRILSGTEAAEREGWHEPETKASACSSGMEDEGKHLS